VNISLLLLGTTALVTAPKAEAAGELLDYFTLSGLALHEVVGLSSNGSMAAFNGYNDRNKPVAYHWNGERYADVGGLDRNVSTIALGISGDGAALVGISLDPYQRTRAFRWTETDGIQDLGTLRADGSGNAWAFDASGDGTVVVGMSYSDELDNERAFAWIDGATGGQSQDGQMFMLEPFPGADRSGAHAVSADGNYAAGYSEVEDDVPIREAMRWDIGGLAEGGGASITYLGTLGGDRSEATDISDDGMVVVGSSELAGGDVVHAFRWVEDEQMYDLGVLEGHLNSSATAVSGDGNVVVGASYDVDGREWAFRWDEAGGMIPVEDWLAANDVVVGGMRLAQAQAVNGDGFVIAGMMEDEDGNERAYIARVTPPDPDPDPEPNPDPNPNPNPNPNPDPNPGSGLMDVEEYHRALFSTAQVAHSGEFLTWLPMNGAHHRPLMAQGQIGKNGCVWATGDLGFHAGSDTGIGLAEVGACVDLVGGNVRAGLGVGHSRSWQSLHLNGTAELAGQYVIGEIDWQPEGTPLLLSVTGMLGGWDADINRAYTNGAATAHSVGATDVTGGAVRMRADWLGAVVIGNTNINPWASFAAGHTHLDGYTERGGPFPATFESQDLGVREARVGVTAVTQISEQSTFSATLEVAHRGGTAPSASGSVPGIFDFNLGGGNKGETWARLGADFDHKLTDNAALSLSTHVATDGRDPSVSGSIGFKASF